MPTQDPRIVARHLGVTAATVQRWKRTGNAPRAVHVALFMESPWGAQHLHAHVVNGERFARALAESLDRENAALRVRIARLEALAAAGDGAANLPYWRAL